MNNGLPCSNPKGIELVPRWMVPAVSFMALILACAACLYTGPNWFHLVRLPARAASEPTATGTPAPTRTPRPTVTVTRPVTVIPQQPTRLAPTAVRSNSLELQRYRTKVTGNISSMGTAMGELTPLVQNPRLGERDWTIAVAARFVVIQQAHSNLAAINPPEEAAYFHALLIDATADCSASTKQYARAVDELDSELMKSAGQLMKDCGVKLSAANRRIPW